MKLNAICLSVAWEPTENSHPPDMLTYPGLDRSQWAWQLRPSPCSTAATVRRHALGPVARDPATVEVDGQLALRKHLLTHRGPPVGVQRGLRGCARPSQ